MDQLQTTEAELYERLFPGRPLPEWLGAGLRYPVRDIPTVEDWQREQGMAGVPTEEQSARETGQGALDYLTMFDALRSVLRGGSGAAQELMGKRRGAETFGKEMMDTSRRALPQKWEQIQAEQWRPGGEAEVGPVHGRQSYVESEQLTVAPGQTPQWRRGEMQPSDVVAKGPLTYVQPGRQREVTAPEVYRVGALVTLPDGQQAQYLVVPSALGYHVALYDGTTVRLVGPSVNSSPYGAVRAKDTMGEALAKARQLQNRLALAAKDYQRFGAEHGAYAGGEVPSRHLRFPWERGTGLFGDDPNMWRGSYQSPPASGRWTE